MAPGKRRGRTKMMFALLCLIGAGILGGLTLLWAWSPGQLQPFLDNAGQRLPNSLSEKIFVPINGTDQGMFIESKNIANPVLLFVHGGPGMPEFWMTREYPTGLEDFFTVVWWEQRGAGLSFDSRVNPEDMTAEQFIADTLEVTRYLTDRFGKEKIYLIGHSWGSYMSIQAAARAPELYHAYIGMGQISRQLESELRAYEYALDRYGERGDTRMLRKLEAAPPALAVPLPRAYMALRDSYMHNLGIGTTRNMKSVITGIFLPSFRFPGYTLIEKINLWRGKILSRSSRFGLWEAMLATDLPEKVKELAIPVYFLHGRYDYTCNYTLAKTYFDSLEAPMKGFYTFEESAHSPLFEEPAKARSILAGDVAGGKITLADPGQNGGL